MNIRKRLDRALERVEELEKTLDAVEDLEAENVKLKAENRRLITKIDRLEDQKRFRAQFRQLMAARKSWGDNAH